MENASKALLIAGGVLLFVLISSFAIYMFKTMGKSASVFYDEMNESEVREFNQQFLNYEDYVGKARALTVQDVVSIINLAQAHNRKPRFPVTVTVRITGNITKNNAERMTDDEIKRFIEERQFDKRYKYSYTECKVGFDGSTKYALVNSIEIKEEKTDIVYHTY